MQGNGENEVKVDGVFGGVECGNIGAGEVNIEGLAGAEGQVVENAGVGIENAVAQGGASNLPAKVGFWSKLKSIIFAEINVELTPHQQKVEKEINDFLYQDITWKKVKNFLFQEIKF